MDSLIFLGHMTCAKILAVPELELDEIESKRLADAVEKLAPYYIKAIDAKSLAWAQFIMAAGSVYGPRAIAFARKPVTSKIATPKPVPVANNPGAQSNAPVDNLRPFPAPAPAPEIHQVDPGFFADNTGRFE